MEKHLYGIYGLLPTSLLIKKAMALAEGENEEESRDTIISSEFCRRLYAQNINIEDLIREAIRDKKFEMAWDPTDQSQTQWKSHIYLNVRLAVFKKLDDDIFTKYLNEKFELNKTQINPDIINEVNISCLNTVIEDYINREVISKPFIYGDNDIKLYNYRIVNSDFGFGIYVCLDINSSSFSNFGEKKTPDTNKTGDDNLIANEKETPNTPSEPQEDYFEEQCRLSQNDQEAIEKDEDNDAVIEARILNHLESIYRLLGFNNINGKELLQKDLETFKFSIENSIHGPVLTFNIRVILNKENFKPFAEFFHAFQCDSGSINLVIPSADISQDAHILYSLNNKTDARKHQIKKFIKSRNFTSFSGYSERILVNYALSMAFIEIAYEKFISQAESYGGNIYFNNISIENRDNGAALIIGVSIPQYSVCVKLR
jgi:hypothetical protein